MGQHTDGAAAVIHNTHFHAFPGFSDQDLQDPVPHIAGSDEKVFQKNKSFGGFQLLQHLLEFFFPKREVGHLRMVIDGAASIAAQIDRKIVKVRIFLLYGIHERFLLRQKEAGLIHGLLQQAFSQPVAGIEPDEEQLAKDPLWVNVSNFWQMPVDGDSLKGTIPEIRCVKPMKNFAGFLERKFYTYNAANGTVSFVGALLGYKDLGSAAYDKRIIDILEGVYDETSRALAKKHGVPPEEQVAFAGTSRAKLQDKAIIDTIERNARDPLRKLGKDDRLVGSANLVLETGIIPEHLCISIAAAIYYVSPGDPSAEELVRMRTEEGIDAVLTKVCSLDPDGVIGKLVKEKINLLKEWGWIHE